MVIAFQILLIFIMFISFIGVMVINMILQDKLTGIFYMSLLAFIVTVIWI